MKNSRMILIKPIQTFWLASVLFISCTEQSKPRSEQINVPVTGIEQASARKKEINFNRYKANQTTEIGREVLGILQDKNDNYWFGTNEGVYLYNERNLIVFSSKDGLFQNQVRDIQEDHLGNIWFATGGYGVNCFNGDTIVTYKVNENAQLKNAGESDWKIEDEDLWFYAGGGVFRYANDTLHYLPLPEKNINSKYYPGPPYQGSHHGVYAVLKDRGGNLWFGTQAGGVCRYDGKIFTWFTEKGLGGPAVLALFQDRNGTIWFGNNGEGLFRYDGKTLTNVTAESDLSNPEFRKAGKSGPGTLARVWAINEDNSGNLWIGTADAGVWQYDGRSLKNFTAIHGLPGSAIETIYKDKKGELWFGTNGDGVYKFDGQTFKKFKPSIQVF